MPDVSPQAVLAHGPEGLSGLGLSMRKIDYLLDLAAHFDREPDLGTQLLVLGRLGEQPPAGTCGAASTQSR